jgi:hypothetical protein
MKQCLLSQACCSLNENTILELCLLTVIPCSDFSHCYCKCNRNNRNSGHGCLYYDTPKNLNSYCILICLHHWEWMAEGHCYMCKVMVWQSVSDSSKGYCHTLSFCVSLVLLGLTEQLFSNGCYGVLCIIS